MEKNQAFSKKRKRGLELKTAIGIVILLLFVMTVYFQKIQVLGNEETQTIRVGYVGYEGFLTQDENGNYIGYGKEFLEEIAIYTGWKYEFIYGTIEGHMEKLKTGEIDLLMQIQKTYRCFSAREPIRSHR